MPKSAAGLEVDSLCFVCADFKRNATFAVSRLINVNLYQLMCHVMQLRPLPHNGTWSNVCDVLANSEACADGPYRGGGGGGDSSMAMTSWRQDAAGFALMIVVALVSIVLC